MYIRDHAMFSSTRVLLPTGKDLSPTTTQSLTAATYCVSAAPLSTYYEGVES